MKNVSVFTRIAGKIVRFETDCPSEHAHRWIDSLRGEVLANPDCANRTSPVFVLIHGGKDV